MSDSDSLMRAARNILVRSFGLRRDQNVLIFVDPAAADVADVVARAARGLDIASAIFLVTPSMQSDLGATRNLPLTVEAAIRDADAILSCLSDRPEHLPYRLRVLRTGWSHRAKVAHSPGMTLDILRMADTDFGFVNECGQLLALALILGKRAEVITRDHRDREHRLVLEIGGWSCPPGISDGVIPDGAWGNVPPGEVYTVPQDGVGEIVINGSMPGWVFGPGEELILTINGGRLVEWQPADSPAGRHLYETQIAYAERHGDPNWANLAELGFGLNPAVHELVGVELVDEKKAGTVHIALGLSTTLGGTVNSVIHADLVVERPTVSVDGCLLLEDGRWRVNETDWRLDHRTADLPAGWWESAGVVRRSGIRASLDHDRLMCQWNSGRGRTDSTPVGTEQTARLAAKLFSILPENGEMLSRHKLLTEVRRAGLEPSQVPGLLWVMHQYDLVRLSGDQQS